MPAYHGTMLFAAALLLQTVVQVDSVPRRPPEPPHPADGIRNALSSAELAIMRGEVCAAQRPSYGRMLEPLRTRFTSAWQSAQPLYGRRVTPRFGGVDIVVPCTGKLRSRYLRDARAALSRFDETLEKKLSEMRGLWIGPFRLCRDTVESVRLIEDHDGSMQPVITFAPSLQSAIRAETEQRVELPMGIYLDGRLLIAPFIREPITREMMFSGPGEVRTKERIRAAAARSC